MCDDDEWREESSEQFAFRKTLSSIMLTTGNVFLIILIVNIL